MGVRPVINTRPGRATTYECYVAEFQLLPDLYSAKLGLPPVNAHHGKLCLRTLAARQPFDQLPAYDGLMSLLFAQLKAEAAHEHATTR